MFPTNKFRFLLSLKGKKEIKTLQQWWEQPQIYSHIRLDEKGNEIVSQSMGEWREIPIEKVEEYL